MSWSLGYVLIRRLLRVRRSGDCEDDRMVLCARQLGEHVGHVGMGAVHPRARGWEEIEKPQVLDVLARVEHHRETPACPQDALRLAECDGGASTWWSIEISIAASKLSSSSGKLCASPCSVARPFSRARSNIALANNQRGHTRVAPPSSDKHRNKTST